MCVTFHNNERAYQEWLDENPDTFVFNDFTGESVLHKSSCTMLHRESDFGRRTVVPKICCTSKDCILSMITRKYGKAGEAWRFCKAIGTDCW